MDTEATTKELVQLEKRYWQAIKDRDVATCVDLSSDPCVVTGAQGVGLLSKEQMRTMMEKQAQYTLDEFDLKDIQAHLLGPDTAIVAYGVKEKITVDGKALTLEAADSSTWVRRDGKWECALHTEAVLGDPFGRDKAARQ
jgi:uncharacterized protein (TIGR02246 family)